MLSGAQIRMNFAMTETFPDCLKKNITYFQISKGIVFLKLGKGNCYTQNNFFLFYQRKNILFWVEYWTVRNTQIFFSFKKEVYPNEFWKHCDVICFKTIEYISCLQLFPSMDIQRKLKNVHFLHLNSNVDIALGH